MYADLITTRRCSHCDGEKPIEEFHRNKRGVDGLSSWCKDCRNSQQRDHLAEQRHFAAIGRAAVVAGYYSPDGTPRQCINAPAPLDERGGPITRFFARLGW